jgi:hypothetical protein
MSKNLWDDEEDFRDIPEETKLDENGNLMVAPPVRLAGQSSKQLLQMPEREEYLEVYGDQKELLETKDDDDEEDYSAVLSDARVRLEMGRLYDMIMNHELFNGVDADPKAAKSVQKQIRNFAKEQMEIMLGMRQTAPILGVDYGFNSLEVEVLKKLASTASKGATQSEDAEEIAYKISPKKQSLNSIGPSKPLIKKEPVVKKSAPTKLSASPEAPVERIRARKLPKEFEEEYEPLKRPVEEMTPEELKERNKEGAKRQANRKAAMPKDIMPQPTYEQQEMLYAQRFASDTKTANTVATIMHLMNNQRK